MGIGSRHPRQVVVFRRLLAVLVVVILLLASIWVVTRYAPPRVVVDGDFSDWEGVPRFLDTIERVPEIHADIDIVEYAASADVERLGFYVMVAGRAMGGKSTDRGADALQVFLDTDRNAGSGYQVYGVGADFVINITGWDGNVQAADLYAWEGSGGTDLIKFQERGSVRVATSGDQLEGSLRLSDIDVGSGSQPVRMVLRTSNSAGQDDWADAAVNQFPPALSLRYTQPQEGTTMNLLATAHNDNITLVSITVRFESMNGGSALGRADIIAQGRLYPGSGPGPTSIVSFVPPLVLMPSSQGLMLQVQTSSLAGALAVRPAVLYSNDIVASAAHYATCEVSVKPAPGYTHLSTIGVAPGDIRIDGAFDDWSMLGGLTGEASGDVRNRALDADSGYPYKVDNRNVDITGYQVRLTPSGRPTHVSFAIRTRGHVMGGLVVDNPVGASIIEPTPGPSGEPLKNMYLQDRIIIFIDRDPASDAGNVTGVRVLANQSLFGADYYLDIAGKSGRIISSLSKLYEYQLNFGWREVAGFAVSAATDYSNLETKVPLANMGMSPLITPNVYFVTTDWCGNYDDTAVR